MTEDTIFLHYEFRLSCLQEKSLMQALGRYAYFIYDQGTGSVSAHLVEVHKVT